MSIPLADAPGSGVHIRTELSRDLGRLLRESYGAQLAGSWSSAEAHLPAATGRAIASLSDVDVMVDGKAGLVRAKAIRESVITFLLAQGIEVIKVSIRKRTEIEALWDSRRWFQSVLPADVAGRRYLHFWAIVGALEAYPVKGDPMPNDYGLIKFFFKASRNLISDVGYRASYRETMRAACKRGCPRESVLSAYRVKLGRDTSLSPVAARQLLDWVAWMQRAAGAAGAAAITEDVTQWLDRRDVLPIAEYVRCSRDLVDGPAMAHARWRAVVQHVGQSIDHAA